MGNTTAKLDGYETASEDDDFAAVAGPSTSKGKGKKRGVKRKGATDPAEPGPSSKKVTKLDTAKYVYEKLFLGGEGSDVTVCAVGHMWNLHKLYLKQCRYFDAIFREDSHWKEGKDKIVRLEFPDGKVTVDALHAVLGSLYHNEITLDLNEVEGILSAASVLQLESILDKSAELMVEEVGDANVLRFLNCSLTYGQPAVLQKCSEFLKWNFWRLAKDKEFLTMLPSVALARLISSPDTLVMEGEQDMYTTVKQWIYLDSGGVLRADEEEFKKEMSAFYAKETDIYAKYAVLWSGIRIHNLITSMGSIKLLEKDNIIPREVLQAAIVDQWKSLLKNEEDPTIVSEVTEDTFNLSSHRLGRIVDTSPKCWRWTGFNSGVDVILNFSHGILTMKRNCLSQSTPYSVNIQTERNVMYRVVMTDMKGKKLFDTGRQDITMRIDQSVVVARLIEDFTLPISVHLFYLATLPPPPSFLYINQYAKIRQTTADKVQVDLGFLTADSGDSASE